jgi:hypothetical protein
MGKVKEVVYRCCVCREDKRFLIRGKDGKLYCERCKGKRDTRFRREDRGKR